jgi:hypothetical protein
MLFQLKNGKCIELSVEQYLRMSDEELNGLESVNWSQQVEDPFAISVLYYGPASNNNNDEDDFEYEDTTEDLTDISVIEKLTDSDFIDIDNIEV